MSPNSPEYPISDWEYPAYQRFIDADGEVVIAVGESGEDTMCHHRDVLAYAIRSYGINDLDKDRLKNVEPIEIDERTFHGCRFDYDTGHLVEATAVPALWQPGGFAYAFSNPPYNLRVDRSEIQKLYSDITSQLIPNQNVKVYNWHRKELLEAVPQLGAGTEWWGVFAFTIFVPTSFRLFGMVASATD